MFSVENIEVLKSLSPLLLLHKLIIQAFSFAVQPSLIGQVVAPMMLHDDVVMMMISRRIQNRDELRFARDETEKARDDLAIRLYFAFVSRSFPRDDLHARRNGN